MHLETGLFPYASETVSSVKIRGGENQQPKGNMNKSTKALVIGAAMAGLMAGSAAVQANAAMASKAGTAVTMADDTKDTHACKGKNTCKGKGGCKSGDNGCKGKNSCKGKGGCATDGSTGH